MRPTTQRQPSTEPQTPNAGPDALTAAVRALVFAGTVPVRIDIAPNDLPHNANRAIETYYLQAPRIAYLALLLAEIRRNLVDLVLDSNAAAAAVSDADLWFETQDGTPLRWHWPIGLLYDLHYLSHEPTLLPARPVTVPSSLASVFAPFDSPSDADKSPRVGGGGGSGPDLSLSVGGGGDSARTRPTDGRLSSSVATLRAPSTASSSARSSVSSAASRARTPSGPTTSSTASHLSAPAPAPPMNRAPSASSFRQSTSGLTSSSPASFPGTATVGPATQPWRIVLRMRCRGGGSGTPAAAERGSPAPAPGGGDQPGPPASLMVGGYRPEEIRTAFMALVKESDYVRWGSTKRVMNLRKEQQDSLWEAVMQNDFDRYWQVASKLVPLPAPPSTASAPASSASSSRIGTPSSSPSPSQPPPPEGRTPDANGVKYVPIRVYLPEGGAVVQELVAPLRSNGSATTLRQALAQLVPLLFPSAPNGSASSTPAPSPPLAYPLIQGVYPPFESELGWLGACMAGPDGWVSVVLALADSSPSSEEQDRGSDSSDEKRGKESLLRPGRARKRWVMHSHGKAHHQRRRDEKGTGSSEEESDSGSGSDGDDDGNHRGDTLHLSTKTRTLITLAFLVILLAAGGFVAWNWGKTIYSDTKDFLIFPTVTTPIDLTGLAGSVFSEATAHVVGAFSTATAAVVGAEQTATAAVAGAEQTATTAVAGAAKDAGSKVTAGLGNAAGAIGGIFGG
ncbi:hypothetical protein JCM8202_002517 [Rhodotorula sphaerocarpa]